MAIPGYFLFVNQFFNLVKVQVNMFQISLNHLAKSFVTLEKSILIIFYYVFTVLSARLLLFMTAVEVAGAQVIESKNEVN